jgi:hypothetical protein
MELRQKLIEQLFSEDFGRTFSDDLLEFIGPTSNDYIADIAITEFFMNIIINFDNSFELYSFYNNIFNIIQTVKNEVIFNLQNREVEELKDILLHEINNTLNFRKELLIFNIMNGELDEIFGIENRARLREVAHQISDPNFHISRRIF